MFCSDVIYHSFYPVAEATGLPYYVIWSDESFDKAQDNSNCYIFTKGKNCRRGSFPAKNLNGRERLHHAVSKGSRPTKQ